ncbi:MAG: 30S ribosomal protein S4 [Phycisphaerae bacterium]|nr:30S ribosomal protein S4 [Phycisphaerae bacterium]
MGNYCGPKVRLSRSVGAAIAETPKHVSPRKANRPGMHGYRRARQTLYGRQLVEKQKVAFYYNIRNTQMRHYVAAASHSKKDASVALQEFLESRLDNVVRRLCWARTIWQARQMVTHGHFLINGRRVDVPSLRVKEGDVISVKEKSKMFVKNSAASSEGPLPPEWLSLDENKMEARVTRLPLPEDVRMPFEPNFNMIIEFYTR